MTELEENLTAIKSQKDTYIIPSNIRQGVTVFGVQGNLAPDKPDQTKTATPSTSSQTIEPDTGYELASVTINPVTASIDADIVAGNIKHGIDILGVSGSLSELSYNDYITALELAENILGTEEYENTMEILNDVDNGSDTYTGLGATEDEIEEILNEVLTEPVQDNEEEEENE